MHSLSWLTYPAVGADVSGGERKISATTAKARTCSRQLPLRAQMKELSMHGRRIAAILLSLLGLTVIPVGRANADQLCQDGAVCVWQHVNFGGCKATLGLGASYNDPAVHWDNCPGSPSKQVSSYASRINYDEFIGFYTKTRNGVIQPPIYCVARGASGNVPAKYNDKFIGHYLANHESAPCETLDRD
jgi:hypothetical protein